MPAGHQKLLDIVAGRDLGKLISGDQVTANGPASSSPGSSVRNNAFGVVFRRFTVHQGAAEGDAGAKIARREAEMHLHALTFRGRMDAKADARRARWVRASNSPTCLAARTLPGRRPSRV